MLLKEIVLTNFGQFYGRQRLDLAVRLGSGRNIVLIGGLNGAGKTSLLNAIQIALYGNRMMRFGVGGESYYSLVEKYLNWKAAAYGETRLSVSITFERPGLQGPSEVTVERVWDLNQPPIRFERVTVVEDGIEQQNMSPEQYDDFIRSFIPEPISHFFFFDGEQIQRMANDEAHDKDLVSAIEDILNITDYRQLSNDLQYYAEQQKRDNAGKDTRRSDVLRIEAQLEENKENRRRIETEIASAEDELRRLEWERERLRREIQRYGGSNAPKKRAELEEQIAQAEGRRDEYLKRLRELANSELPFAILYDELQRLKDRLRQDKEIQRNRAVTEELYKRIDTLLDIVRDKVRRLNVTNVDNVLRAVREAVDEAFALDVPDVEEGVLVHALSDAERDEVISFIEKDLTPIADEFRDLAQRLEKAQRELDALRAERNTTPTDSAYDQLVDQFEEISTRRGRTQERLQELRKNLERLQDARQQLERQRTSALRALEVNEAVQRKIDTALHYKRAIDAFIERMVVQKTSDVERHLNEMYSRLARKGNHQIREFRIGERFTVTAVSSDGREIPKEKLSAGEKQIYAISLLWALAKSSRRELPIVIDTPLARLDGVHRRNIVEHYLPHASHQVVVVSTDTEIDAELYRLLLPHIEHSYRLEYDVEGSSAQVVDGYFFTEEVAANG